MTLRSWVTKHLQTNSEAVYRHSLLLGPAKELQTIGLKSQKIAVLLICGPHRIILAHYLNQFEDIKFHNVLLISMKTPGHSQTFL